MFWCVISVCYWSKCIVLKNIVILEFNTLTYKIYVHVKPMRRIHRCHMFKAICGQSVLVEKGDGAESAFAKKTLKQE